MTAEQRARYLAALEQLRGLCDELLLPLDILSLAESTPHDGVPVRGSIRTRDDWSLQTAVCSVCSAALTREPIAGSLPPTQRPRRYSDGLPWDDWRHSARC